MAFSAAVCFVVCHGGPADHFAVFAKLLMEERVPVRVYVAESFSGKFQGIEGVEPFSLEKTSAEELAQKCSRASCVITDVGHSFDVLLQEALAKYDVTRFAYYDNPEPFVPGGHSKTAADVMLAAQKVLFANANLERSPIYREEGVEVPIRNRVGIGYYPVQRAKEIVQRREKERLQKRAELGIREDQKVLVYFGGNNEAYFEKAFPAFLSFLREEDDFVILLQQHPGAKDKNRDLAQIKNPKILVSQWNSDDAQVVADAALYYQTSMGPLFALAGIPAIQVGHEIYEDILVRGKLCHSATNRAEFVEAIEKIEPKIPSKEEEGAVRETLGIREDWFERFSRAVI